MNNLPQIFNYHNKKIRVVMIDGEPWFVAHDACDILGLRVSGTVRGKKVRNYEDGLDSEDYREVAGVAHPLGKGGSQRVLAVSEGGLYDLIFKSHKPEAKPFKRWVTHELIPTVRKTGAYITNRADPEMLRAKADQNERLSDVNILAQTVLPVYTAAGMKPQFQLLAVKQLYSKAGIDILVGDMTFDRQLYDTEAIARALGMFSEGGKPHAQAALAVINRLEVRPEEKELVPYTRNGHSGTCYQYTADVIEKARWWLSEHNYPVEIQSMSSKHKRVYKIRYSQVPARA